MQDTELYRYLLGIEEPWTVERVTLDMENQRVDVWVTHPEGIFKGAPPSSKIVIFLNKVDIPDGIAKAKSIAQKISNRKNRQIERIVLGQLKNESPIAEVIFP
jgi:probable selenium-dependent hydroxylase accessory protein YqeC